MKATQTVLKTLFRLIKEKLNEELKVKVAGMDDLKRGVLGEWFKVKQIRESISVS